MKKIKLLLICFICFGNIYAQGIKNNGNSVAVEIIKKGRKVSCKVEVAGFEKSDSSWVQNVQNNVNESIQDCKKIKRGKYFALVKFVMSKDGDVCEIVCNNDPGFGICESVIRVLKKSKKWEPSEPVQVRELRVTNQ